MRMSAASAWIWALLRAADPWEKSKDGAVHTQPCGASRYRRFLRRFTFLDARTRMGLSACCAIWAPAPEARERATADVAIVSLTSFDCCAIESAVMRRVADSMTAVVPAIASLNASNAIC